MIGVGPCHACCLYVLPCLVFVCSAMFSVWMFCHDWCVDVMS